MKKMMAPSGWMGGNFRDAAPVKITFGDGGWFAHSIGTLARYQLRQMENTNPPWCWILLPSLEVQLMTFIGAMFSLHTIIFGQTE